MPRYIEVEIEVERMHYISKYSEDRDYHPVTVLVEAELDGVKPIIMNTTTYVPGYLDGPGNMEEIDLTDEEIDKAYEALSVKVGELREEMVDRMVDEAKEGRDA